jgi:Tol biopolymer transport system component
MVNAKNSILVFCFFLLISGCSTGDDKFPDYREYSEIYSMNVDGTNLGKLTEDKKYITFMQYLGKSDKILFVQNGTYIMNSDGSERQLLSTKSINRNCKVTQDEKTIYFVETKTVGLKVNSILYTMLVHTGELKEILNDSSEIHQMTISLDGSQLLYVSFSRSPFTCSLYLLNSVTLEKKKVKEWANDLYCSFPQFLQNGNSILFFEKIYSNRNDAFLRIMDLTDSSKTNILDTVSSSYYEYAYPKLNSNDEIFYTKNGITVLNVNSNQKKSIPTLFLIDYDFINWSYDGTKVTSTENINTQLIIYSLNDASLTKLKPDEGDINSDPYRYPFLNYNNSKIFFTIRFRYTVYI